MEGLVENIVVGLAAIVTISTNIIAIKKIGISNAVLRKFEAEREIYEAKTDTLNKISKRNSDDIQILFKNNVDLKSVNQSLNSIVTALKEENVLNRLSEKLDGITGGVKEIRRSNEIASYKLSQVVNRLEVVERDMKTIKDKSTFF